jgi:DNA-binding XRE family transcriptional regulator
MSKLNGKIVKAVRVRNTDLGRIVGESLRTLRELAGLTQSEIAARLNVGQAAISKIERRGDVLISSLHNMWRPWAPRSALALHLPPVR